MWTWRVRHVRSIDVGGYQHNNKGFCENFIFPKSINRGRTILTRSTHVSLMENSYLSSLPLMVTRVQEEIYFSSDLVDPKRPDA